MFKTPALEETTVIVVNYNAIDVIANCLEPLLEAKEIIVVDNDSTDQSLAMIAERFPPWMDAFAVKLRESGVFERGPNQGMNR